jgi:hypothetical protein
VARTGSADSLSRLIQFVVLDDLIVFFDCPDDLLFFVDLGCRRGRCGFHILLSVVRKRMLPSSWNTLPLS